VDRREMAREARSGMKQGKRDGYGIREGGYVHR